MSGAVRVMRMTNQKTRIPYKWLLLFFLFVAFFLEQGARQVYGSVLPQIRLDFAALGVSGAQLGLVSSAFTLVFGLSLVVAGFAADFLGRKRVLVAGTLLYAVGVIGGGCATGLAALVAFYGVVNALGQCCIAPASYSLISQCHTTETRATAMGVFQSANYLGVCLASVSAGALAGLGPGRWRWAFWAVGGLGVLWALVMQLMMRDTPQPVADGEAKASVRDAFSALLKKPTAILIAVAFGMFTYVMCGFRLWAVTFIVHSFEGVSLAAAAFHAVFWFYLGSLVSLVVSARVIDFLGRRRNAVRLDASILGLVLSAGPMYAVSAASSLVACCLWLFVLGLTCGLYEAGHYPSMFDCIVPRYRSVATGLTGCLAFALGSLAPMALGWIHDAFSLRLGLATLSVFFLLGALVLLPARLFTFNTLIPVF